MLLKNKLQWLSDIPSATGNEQELISGLNGYFSCRNYRKVRISSDNRVNPLAIVPPNKSDIKTVFLAHTDRIPVAPSRLRFLNGCIAGQLDNIIGVAAAMELLDRNPDNSSFAVLFTTEEETLASAGQIIEFVKRYGTDETYIVDIDIDPVSAGKPLYRGISVRKRDSRRRYSAGPLISTAETFNIRYTSPESWLLCQATLLWPALTNPAVFAGVPIVNYHSNREIAYYASLEELVKLLDNFIKYRIIRGEGEVVEIFKEAS